MRRTSTMCPAVFFDAVALGTFFANAAPSRFGGLPGVSSF